MAALAVYIHGPVSCVTTFALCSLPLSSERMSHVVLVFLLFFLCSFPPLPFCWICATTTVCFPLLEKVELFPGLQHLLIDLSAVLTSDLGVQPKTLELKEFPCISRADVRDPVFTPCLPQM